jgi:hypothetical protein
MMTELGLLVSYVIFAYNLGLASRSPHQQLLRVLPSERGGHCQARRSQGLPAPRLQTGQ